MSRTLFVLFLFGGGRFYVCLFACLLVCLFLFFFSGVSYPILRGFGRCILGSADKTLDLRGLLQFFLIVRFSTAKLKIWQLEKIEASLCFKNKFPKLSIPRLKDQRLKNIPYYTEANVLYRIQEENVKIVVTVLIICISQCFMIKINVSCYDQSKMHICTTRRYVKQIHNFFSYFINKYATKLFLFL